jgi:hypothetical protein
MARALVALKLSPKIKNVISFAQNVATALTGNPSFPNPNPPLATFQADIAALSAAESAVLSRAKGAVENRNEKLVILRTDLNNLRSYVETVAAAASPTSADSLIESAGMTTRKVTPHDKPALAVKQGSVSGTVTLAAKAVARVATYSWEYSTDQKTWTSLPNTMKAKTGVSGLTAMTTYYFRMQALTRTGEGSWGQIISFLVQ